MLPAEKGWHCGGTLAVDMKSGHHRHVHVIIAQGDLPCRVIACKTQIIVGNHHPFWTRGGTGGKQNFRRIVSG